MTQKTQLHPIISQRRSNSISSEDYDVYVNCTLGLITLDIFFSQTVYNEVDYVRCKLWRAGTDELLCSGNVTFSQTTSATSISPNSTAGYTTEPPSTAVINTVTPTPTAIPCTPSENVTCAQPSASAVVHVRTYLLLLCFICVFVLCFFH